MTDAQELQNILLRASQGVRKTGFENGNNANVVGRYDSSNDTYTFTCTLPAETKVTATGTSEIVAKDWLTLQPIA